MRQRVVCRPCCCRVLAVASAKYAAPVLHGATNPHAGIGPKHDLQEGQQYGCMNKIRDAIMAKSRVRNHGVRRDEYTYSSMA